LWCLSFGPVYVPGVHGERVDLVKTCVLIIIIIIIIIIICGRIGFRDYVEVWNRNVLYFFYTQSSQFPLCLMLTLLISKLLVKSV